MITKFKIFEKRSIWSHISNTYEDEEAHDIYIDGFVGYQEEGEVLATVDILTGEVNYHDERAKTDEYAQEMIREVIEDIIPERRIEIEAEKYNL
jgi:hypothetical protein